MRTRIRDIKYLDFYLFIYTRKSEAYDLEVPYLKKPSIILISYLN
jgi:hypothetical protein